MSTIEQYISAFNENWAEYEQLKASIPKGGDFSKPGKQGMTIRIGNFSQGVCIRLYSAKSTTNSKILGFAVAHEA